MFIHEEESHIEKIEDFELETNEFILNWIGQAGFVFKTSEDTIVCIDPYYSNSVERYDGRPSRRMWYNKFIIEHFNPDLVLCSHDHLDHTDPETLPLIYAFSEAQFYGPNSSYQHMKKMSMSEDRIKKLKVNKIYEFKDLKFKTVFANHTEDSMGFIFEINDIIIYFTGDTSLDKKLYEYKSNNIDIMISCINGKYNNLNVKEAAALAKKLNVKLVIPMHYGLIADNTVDVNTFIDHFNNEGINHLVMDVEKNYYFSKNDNKITVSRKDER